MKNTLVISKDDEKKRKQLQSLLEKKKKTLLQVTATCETLRNELELIKREYYLRVGNLMKRDNDLDIEIIRLKNLLARMRSGMSRKEALDQMKDSYYSDEHTEAGFDGLPEAYVPDSEDLGNKEKLKALWKKIVRRFHPDLAIDPDEKRRRDVIMRNVNKAYAAQDYEALEEIYNNNHTVHIVEFTVKDLEEMIIRLENSIDKVRTEILFLKDSEWYGWKTKIRKAKKAGTDIFKELERSLLDDIVKKIAIFDALKKDAASFV
jgi:hypothetical protein